MFKAALLGAPIQGYAVFALLIFFTVFSLVMMWVFRRHSQQQYEQMAHLPLENHSPMEPL